MSLISYKKLFYLLLDKDMDTKDLQAITNLTLPTVLKLKYNKIITSETILRICEGLQCQPGDIMEYIDDSGNKPVMEISTDNTSVKSTNQPIEKSEKRGPGRPNKHKEIEEEIKGALLGDPSIPEGLKEVVKTTPLKRNENAEEYRKRLDIITFDRYVEDNEPSEELTPQEQIWRGFLNNPDIGEDLKEIAKSNLPMDYENNFLYRKRILTIQRDTNKEN